MPESATRRLRADRSRQTRDTPANATIGGTPANATIGGTPANATYAMHARVCVCYAYARARVRENVCVRVYSGDVRSIVHAYVRT